MNSQDHLHELWSLYKIRSDQLSLERYFEEFAHTYDKLIDLEYSHIQSDTDQESKTTEKHHHRPIHLLANLLHADKEELSSPSISDLPDGVLQAINRQFLTLRDEWKKESINKIPKFKTNRIKYAICLVKSVTIICKNHANLKLLSSQGFMGLILNIASSIVAMIRAGNCENAQSLQLFEDFLHYTLHLYESMYDPYSIWRRRVKGLSKKNDGVGEFAVPLLNEEIIPFYYDTLQTHKNSLSTDLQLQFLHLFGSLLCGSQNNALLTISPATLDILFCFLSRFMGLDDKTSAIDHDNQHSVPSIHVHPSDGPSQQISTTIINKEGARLVLRIFIKMVHVLHNSSPDKRNLDVKTVLEKYFKLLTKASGNTDIQMQMIRFMPDFLNTFDRPALQVMLIQQGCFNHLQNVLQNYHADPASKEASEIFAVQFVNIVSALVAGSTRAQQTYFGENNQLLLDRLKELCEPQLDILHALVNTSVETWVALKYPQPIKNVFVILLLLQWLPDIKQVQQQMWLANVLKRVFTSCNENKIIAILCKVVSKALMILVAHPHLHNKTVLSLLEMIEQLGSYSMSPRQTAAYIELLRQDSTKHSHMNKYFGRMLHGLSAMAREENTSQKSSHFFDFQDSTSGITMPEIKKWGGYSFSFHVWICLNHNIHEKSTHKYRRQLYSFFANSGNGIEAFFTPECELVVAVCAKKNYFTVKLNETPLTDNKWHCIHIVHQAAKRPFGQNGTLSVYIDGKLEMTTTLRSPSVNEPLTMCHIGSAGLRTSATNTIFFDPDENTPVKMFNESPSTPASNFSSPISTSRFSFNLPSPSQIVRNFPFSPIHSTSKSSTSSPSKIPNNPTKTDRVVTIETGSQDDVWGRAVSLRGQLGSVAVFNDVLTESQVHALYEAGPNKKTILSNNDHVPGDLQSKLVVYYAAKACHKHMCPDLSPTTLTKNGNLSGHKVVTWDVKDSINSIGGIQVLFPLLEEIGVTNFSEQDFSYLESDDLLDDEENADSTLAILEESTESSTTDHSWVVVETRKSSEQRLQRNHVAGFLILLKNFISYSACGRVGRHEINETMLVQCAGIATVGALLQRIPEHMVDADVLISTQLLAESIDTSQPNGSTLLNQVYQYLLFDFRIWSRSSFEVRIGHIQYLATVIKDNRKHFQKKYGVQYMLDVIKNYYSSVDEHLSVDDCRSIRGSLFGLIRYYVARKISIDELHALLGFITNATTTQETQLREGLDLLLSLLDCPCKGEFCRLMYEEGNADSLYMFLIDPTFSEKLRIKALKLIQCLLKTDLVQEKFKTLLKLQQVGFSGIMLLMKDVPCSKALSSLLLDIVVEIDLGSRALFSVLQFLHRCDMWTRRDACKQLLQLLANKPHLAMQCANQHAWQDTLTRMLVHDQDDRSNSVDETASDRIFSDDANSEIEINETITNIETKYPDSGGEVMASRLTGLNLSTPERMFFNGKITRDKSFGESLNKSSSDIGSSIVTSSSRNSFNQLSVDKQSSTSGQTSPTLSDHYFHFEASADEMSTRNGSMSNLLDSDMEFSVSLQDQMEAELCDAVVESIFMIMWRGVDDSQPDAWNHRGQVFASLTKIASNHSLVQSMDHIKTRLLEMCTCTALSDLKETSGNAGNTRSLSGNTISLISMTEKSAELIRHVHDFLTSHGVEDTKVWSEKLVVNMFNLLDVLLVWDNNNSTALNGSTEWSELADIGLRLLLGCINTGVLELVAMAAARLHHLLHCREPKSTAEICYLLGNLNKTVWKSLKDKTHVVEFVVPLIRDLLDQNYERLGMAKYLSSMPPTSGSATFYEDFVKYSESSEWQEFISRHIQPINAQHEEDTYRDAHNDMTKFWLKAQDELMTNCHKRDREAGESKLRFQTQIEEPFRQRKKNELDRQAKNSKQLLNQHTAALRMWRGTKRFLTGGRGPWKERNPADVHWKLSNVENFSRMRLKLTENYNFDPHVDASKLRDNLEVPEDSTQISDSSLIPANAVKHNGGKASNLDDDNVGDEDWNTLTSAEGSTEVQVQKEKVVFTDNECHLVTLMDYIPGKLDISTTHVYFYDMTINKDEESGRDFKWSLAQLREVHFRRYNLRRSGLELFLVDQTNYFINFGDTKQRMQAYKALLSVRPPSLMYFGSRSPQDLLKASGLMQKWVQREISNFDYLMQLNTIAGRTYNDLSQYPVFPWILKDYSSEKLDFENPDIYRDLSKPVGVQNPDNETEVREKFVNFEDPGGVIEKFHYGTHYSNAAGVLHYLLRMEPFTTLHIELQSGRFDLADRQFHSLPASWQAIYINSNDVKELIPEFFYLPDFLVNSNEFDLGTLQISKETVNNVILPKWAKTPEDFVFLHRKALESEYVSQHLNQWIDLIFGYKQKGEAAAEALNVFYYCTYEGAVDLDAISDPVQRKAVEGMINNFGQTPTQLLKEPHPRRMLLEEAAKKLATGGRLSPLTGDVRSLNVLEHPSKLKAFYAEVMGDSDPLAYVCVPKSQSRSFIQAGMPDTLITVSKSGVLGLHGWLPYDKSITNFFTFERDPTIAKPGSSGKLDRNQRRLQGFPIPGMSLSPNLFVTSHDGKMMFIGGHWDNSVRVISLIKMKSVTHLVRHFDIVTCLALDNNGSHLISGSVDTTCVIWQVQQHNGTTTGVVQQPLQVLYGHESEVTCVAINTELDIAVSASKDGTCIIHTVRKGNYVRTIRPVVGNTATTSIPLLALSEEGHVAFCTYSNANDQEKLFLHLFSINGKHLGVDCLENKLVHMVAVDNHLITADNKGVLVIRELFSLETRSHLALKVPLSCIAVTKQRTHILACLKDGKLIIVGVADKVEPRSLF